MSTATATVNTAAKATKATKAAAPTTKVTETTTTPTPVVEKAATPVEKKTTTTKGGKTAATTTTTTASTTTTTTATTKLPLTESTTPTSATSGQVEATPDVTPMGNTVEGAENVFGPRFAALLDRLTSLTADLREVSVQVRSLQKEHTRFVRENTKKNAKRQRVTKRNASGFAKPTLLSDEMYAFLGIEKGTMVVRNDVTRRINAYVVEHKLRNETDKRRIVPNDALKALTNVSDADTLTYFNIQKYIKHHFVKPTVAAPVA